MRPNATARERIVSGYFFILRINLKSGWQAKQCPAMHFPQISAVLVTRSSHWWCGCWLDVSNTVVWCGAATGLESGHHPSPRPVQTAVCRTAHRALHFYKIQSRLIKISWKAGVAVGWLSRGQHGMITTQSLPPLNLKKNVPTRCTESVQSLQSTLVAALQTVRCNLSKNAKISCSEARDHNDARQCSSAIEQGLAGLGLEWRERHQTLIRR